MASSPENVCCEFAAGRRFWGACWEAAKAAEVRAPGPVGPLMLPPVLGTVERLVADWTKFGRAGRAFAPVLGWKRRWFWVWLWRGVGEAGYWVKLKGRGGPVCC